MVKNQQKLGRKRWVFFALLAIAMASTAAGLIALELEYRQITASTKQALTALRRADRLQDLGRLITLAALQQQNLQSAADLENEKALRLTLRQIRSLSQNLSRELGTLPQALQLSQLTKDFGQTAQEALGSKSGVPAKGAVEVAFVRWQPVVSAFHRQTIEQALRLEPSPTQGKTRSIVSRLSLMITAVLWAALMLFWRNRGAQLMRQRDEQQRLLHEQQLLVEQRNVQLEELAGHLQNVSEEEKGKLARELHDELGALLTASKMDVCWVHGRLKEQDVELSRKLLRTLNHLDEGIQIKRRIIEGMRPTLLDNFGLTTALRGLLEESVQQNGWELQLDLPDDELELPEAIAIVLFRIAQESLHNAAKHAHASHVRLTLKREPHQVLLEIEDNGVGILKSHLQQPNRHGIVGMRQRLVAHRGHLEVRSAPQQGTEVCATIPLPLTTVAQKKTLAA